MSCRITDENFESALTQAHCRPLDVAYDEPKAARVREPQVIVRPGIGRVLALNGVPIR